jgi:hypothetical protein
MIYLVIGWKIESKPLGIAADYCPYCRVPRPFTIFETSQQTHAYFISVHESKLEHSMQCHGCQFSFSTTIDRYAKLKSESGEIEDLIITTFPNLTETYSKEIQLAHKAINGELNAKDRLAWLKEPFQIVNPLIISLSPTRLIIQEGIVYGAIIAVALGVQAGCIGTQFSRKDDFAVGIGFVTTFLVGLISVPLSLYFRIRASRNSIRTIIYPLLARTLAPSKPTLDEIRAVFAALQEVDVAAGDKLNAEELHSHLQHFSANTAIPPRAAV